MKKDIITSKDIKSPGNIDELEPKSPKALASLD